MIIYYLNKHRKPRRVITKVHKKLRNLKVFESYLCTYKFDLSVNLAKIFYITQVLKRKKNTENKYN